MDSLADQDELTLDQTSLHKLFHHVAEVYFHSSDPAYTCTVFVPVGNNVYWEATAIILDTNEFEFAGLHEEHVSMASHIQGAMGIETRPGWYEVAATTERVQMKEKEVKALVSRCGSKKIKEMFEWLFDC